MVCTACHFEAGLPGGFCGDGVIDDEEACDGVTGPDCAYNVAACTVCNAACEIVVGVPGGVCGDGVVDDGDEACDPPTATECAYDEANCTVCSSTCVLAAGVPGGFCGDGIVDDGEEVCDGVTTADDCRDAGFAKGIADCDACTIDTSGCFARLATKVVVADNIVCSLRQDGGIGCVGDRAPATALTGVFIDLAVGASFSVTDDAWVCGLRAAGTVECAGPVPGTAFTQPVLSLASTDRTLCGRRASGGSPCRGLMTSTASGARLIAGDASFCAISAAGVATCSNENGQAFTAALPTASGGLITVAVAADFNAPFVVGLDRQGKPVAASASTPLPLGGPFVDLIANGVAVCGVKASGGTRCASGFSGNLQDASAVPTLDFIATDGDDRTICGTSNGAPACFGNGRTIEARPFATTGARLFSGGNNVCVTDNDGSNARCQGNLFSRENALPGRYRDVFMNDFDSCGVTVGDDIECVDSKGGRYAFAGPFKAADLGVAVTAEGDALLLSPTTARAALLALMPDVPMHRVALAALFSTQVGCGIVDSDRRLVCWGDTANGRGAPPAGRFVAVSTGFQPCAISEAGALTCWGFSTITSPGPFVSLDNGRPCGRKRNGDFVCINGSGEQPQTGTIPCHVLNDGSLKCPENIATRQPQPLSVVPAGTDFVDATNDSDFGVALRQNGTAIMLGADTRPLMPLVDINMILEEGCGLTPSTGALVCWGSPLSHTTPAPNGTAMRDISITFTAGCGVRRDTNALVCWGDGTNPIVSSTRPTGTFAQVEVSGDHACARRTTGAVECWGDSNLGRNAAPAGSFRHLALTNLGGCVLNTAGAATCWGFGPHLPTGVTFLSLRAGDQLSEICGLTATGAVCTTRLPVSGRVVDVAVGTSFSCGMDAAGGVACEGQREQLDRL